MGPDGNSATIRYTYAKGRVANIKIDSTKAVPVYSNFQTWSGIDKKWIDSTCKCWSELVSETVFEELAPEKDRIFYFNIGECVCS